MTPTPTSGAADLPEALRLADIADDESWAFVIGVRKDIAAALRRLHTESEMRRTALLDEMQKAALAAEPDPTPGDHPQPCDSELFESGVSVGLFDIPQWTAEALCKGIAAATGARVDWHYIGGRVHVKALPAPTSAEGVAYAELPASWAQDLSIAVSLLGMARVGKVPPDEASKARWALTELSRALASHGQAPAGVGEVAEHYRNAIASACEGWTMPDGLRKHLETALWSPPTPQPTQTQAGAVPLTCEWTHNEDDGFWETACGEAWRFDDGGPGENNMHFCHSCGNSLRIKGANHDR